MKQQVTFEKPLTYGQIRGMKGIIRILKRLNVKHNIHDIVFNPIGDGGIGFPDMYRIRVRFKDDSY